jgi:hypothetical protein
MTYHDPNDPHPPELDPQPSGKPPRDEEGFDERLWTYGVVIAVIIGAVAVIGGVIWTFRDDHQTAIRPQPPVTGTFGQSVRPEAPVD